MQFNLKKSSAFQKARELVEAGKGSIKSAEVLDYVHRILKTRKLTADFQRVERDGRTVHFTMKNIAVSIAERIEMLPFWLDEPLSMWYWLPLDVIGLVDKEGSCLPRVLVYAEPVLQTVAEKDVEAIIGTVRQFEVFKPDDSGLFTQEQCVADLLKTATECFGPAPDDAEISEWHGRDAAEFHKLVDLINNGNFLGAYKAYRGMDSLPRDYVSAESRNFMYLKHLQAGGKG